MSKRTGREDEATSHLDDIEDGCGCAEVWEQTSEYRREKGETEPGDRA